MSWFSTCGCSEESVSVPASSSLMTLTVTASIAVATVPVAFSAKSMSAGPEMMGGSSTLVMVTVTTSLPVCVPSEAPTLISYVSSARASKSGTSVKLRSPVTSSITKYVASGPERTQEVAPSGSVAL